MKSFWLSIFASVLLFSLPAAAHHSFGATYDVSKEIMIKGTIAQVSLRSPHSFFYVEVPDEKGEPQRWSIEGASASQFAHQGVTSNIFNVGDTVEVYCNPARSASSLRGRLLKITRLADGKSWGGRAGETVQ